MQVRLPLRLLRLRHSSRSGGAPALPVIHGLLLLAQCAVEALAHLVRLCSPAAAIAVLEDGRDELGLTACELLQLRQLFCGGRLHEHRGEGGGSGAGGGVNGVKSLTTVSQAP